MKKLMLVAAMMLVCIGVSAQSQKKQFAVGGNIGVGIYENSYSPLGFGPKFQFYFWKQWRGEASFNYWTKKDNRGYMDFNANAHYVFDVAKNVNVYPLAGITVVTTHGLEEGRDNLTMAGINIGGGAEFFLAPQLKLNLEMKYQYAEKEDTYKFGDAKHSIKYEAEGPVFQAGLAYCF